METRRARDDRGEVRLEPTLLDPDAVLDVGGAPFSEPAPHHEGERVIAGRYRLVGRIGQGRLGEEYEAVDLRLSEAGGKEHRVVLELAAASGGGAHVRERLAAEFRSLLSVSHPNLGRIMDFGVDGGRVFFTAELLEGVSLRSILESDPAEASTEEELLAVLRALADGLSFLHGKGFVHGDLKPESVFITTDYEVKIIDLASVRLRRAAQGSTELRFGGSVPLDVQDDVLGLACVAYEWLSNEHPFAGVSTFEAFRTGYKPRRIRRLPRYRWKALARALEPQPEARTPTVAEFAAEFGVRGKETLREAAREDRGGRRRGFLRLALAVGIIAGIAVLVERNYPDLAELFATLRQVPETASVPGTAPAGEAEIPAPAESGAGEGTGAGDAALFPYAADATGVPAGDDPPSSSVQALPEPGVAAEPSVAVESGTTAAVPTSESTSPAPAPAPLGFRFAEETITVSESGSMASIVLHRTGGLGSEATVRWWTEENTAAAAEDYADLGVRSEFFPADQDSLTVYVPLVSDALVEPRESFNVRLAWDGGPEAGDVLEVFVLDDDS